MITVIEKIRILLEYNTYCLWLYDEKGEIIDNDNPPEWNDDNNLTDAFMAVSDIYDTFFVDNNKEFSFIGCPDQKTRQELKNKFDYALEILNRKNQGKYIIQNDVNIEDL